MRTMQASSRWSRPTGIALLVAAAALPAVASNYIVDVGLTIATYSILGLGLNIVVGYAGLLKAIGNFDPAAGCSLATYARPCISGEIKRHFRDKRWQVRVTRPVQELVLEVREATWRLAQELGRTPAESDITRHLGVSGDDLRQARRAEQAFWPSSLDAPLAGQPGVIILADVLGEEDPRLEQMLGMQAVAAHWGELPAREQKILQMDFGGGMTQVQIGQRLRISQMHVSRLRAHALGYLRSRLLDLREHPK